MFGRESYQDSKDEATQSIKRFSAKFSETSVIDLLDEMSAPKQQAKSRKVRVEKFTFCSIEAWIPAISL